MSGLREDLDFDVEGIRCAAWFYRPGGSERAPCVVMAHGFSGVREQRLDAYAERFAQAGCAVLLFDYRHFGASDGEPRQLLDIERQLQDWEAAIAAARAHPAVDRRRIALFGTSFSGGHVQVLAARDADIAAVIAQAPFCDGLGNLGAIGIGNALRLTAAGLIDRLRDGFGASPLRIPAIGAPGTRAVMTTPDALDFIRLDPPGSHWRNEVCARIALSAGLYRPGRAATGIRCPILYSIAEHDQLTPARLAREAARRAPQAEVRSHPCGHFDVYLPPFWDAVVAEQADFLHRHLALDRSDPNTRDSA